MSFSSLRKGFGGGKYGEKPLHGDFRFCYIDDNEMVGYGKKTLGLRLKPGSSDIWSDMAVM